MIFSAYLLTATSDADPNKLILLSGSANLDPDLNHISTYTVSLET